MFPLIIAAAIAAKTLYNIAKESSSPPPAYTPPHYAPAQKIIAFVGAASSGKSSTGNALLGRYEFEVGAEHGTTMVEHDANYKEGYRIRDVPGLLDGPLSSRVSIESLKTVELVVYVCTGQLFRQEIDFLRELHSKQGHWNLYSPGATRKLVLFCNKRDVALTGMTSSDLRQQDESLILQVSGFIPQNLVFHGSSDPRPPRSPDLNALQSFINANIVQRGHKEENAN